MKPDVALILALLMFPITLLPQAQTPPAGPAVATTLPDLARKSLDKKYKKWTVATVAPQGSCQDRMGPSPAVTTADFNGDGFIDYAAEIATASGVKLVALVGWLQEYQVYELESADGQTASRFLGEERRGTKFTNPKTSLEDYFSQDTLASYSCGKDRIVYLWVGFNFQRAVLPD